MILTGLLANAAGGLFTNLLNQRNATEAYNRQKNLDKINYERQLDLMRNQYNYNKLAADYSWNKEHEFWQEQNAYNSPAAQLSRLRQAGINPALAVGSVNNTSSGLLNMDSPQVSGGSAPSSSAPSTSAAPSLPDISNLLNSVKTLQLISEQVNTQKAQQNYLNSLANNLDARTDETLAGQPYWDVNARYDSTYKQFSAQSMYRDVLEKIWRYTNFLPEQLRDQVLKNAAQDLSNRFAEDTFEDRKNTILLENKVKAAQEKEILQNAKTGRASMLNFGSQIAFRNWYMSQQNKNFEQSRNLQFSQETLNKVRKSMLELQSQVASAMDKGDYSTALKKGILLNFYQQMIQGSLFKGLPSVNSFGPGGSFDVDDFSSLSVLKMLGL